MDENRDVCSLVNNSEPETCVTGANLVASCPEALSPGSIPVNRAHSDSSQSSELVDMKPDDCDSINENKCSVQIPVHKTVEGESCSVQIPVPETVEDDGCCVRIPVPVTAEGDVTLSNHESINCSSNPGMDGINITVDYVIYGDNYFIGCMVTFSSSGIKICSLSSDRGELVFNFERGIEDIMCIESQHVHRFGPVMVKLRTLSKDSEEADKASSAKGIEELGFVVVEPDWSKKWEEIASLNLRYLALWSSMNGMDAPTAHEADLRRQKRYFPEFDESCEEVVYPNGDSDAVSISKRDFDLLQPETFVNDTIIDFYIKYLKNQIPPEKRDKCHFFNSFFFRKLADLDKDPSSISDGGAAFQRVRKWTRKVDIFGKDYIFIPVNFSLHWSLLVICHAGEVAGFIEEDLEKAVRVPCILHMDSIKGTHAGLKTLVQSYLWEEWKERHKDTSEDLSSKFLNLRFVSLELPQQENTFDCGLFLLHYLELFLADAPVNFNPFKINGFSKFLNMDWFLPAEASLKRTPIQRLISELLEVHSPEASTDDSCDDTQPNFSEKNENATVGFVSSASHGNLPNSEACGMNLTLLEGSSSKNYQCVTEPDAAPRGLFEPEAAMGSVLPHCSSFNESSFYRSNGDESHMEEDIETGEQFDYFTSGETTFHHITSVTHPEGSMHFAYRSFENNGSWNPGIYMQGENDDSSSGPSSCGSDDSDIGIIENCQVQTNSGLPQQFSSVEQVGHNGEGVSPVSSEMLKASAAEVTDVCEEMRDGGEKGDLTPCHENLTTSLHEDPDNEVGNGLHQAWGMADITTDDLRTVGDEAEREIDEEVRTKRLRLTPPGDANVTGSLSEDLHL